MTDLLEALNRPAPARLDHATLVAIADDWTTKLGESAGSGQSGGRWYCRLEHNDQYEVYLIGWSGTARTQFHDHGGSSGVVSVVAGELVETRLRHGGSVVRKPGKPGQKFSFAVDIIHDIKNMPGRESLSVHVYSPPLEQQTYYEASAEGVVAIETISVDAPEPGVDLTGNL